MFLKCVFITVALMFHSKRVIKDEYLSKSRIIDVHLHVATQKVVNIQAG